MKVSDRTFLSKPAWLLFDVNYLSETEKVTCNQGPQIIKVKEYVFKLLFCQIIVNERAGTSAHFKGIFYNYPIFYGRKFSLLNYQHHYMAN